MGKYFSFSGVAKRQEFWAVAIIGCLLTIVTVALASFMAMGMNANTIVSTILMLAIVVISLWLGFATTVRRCRDCGLNPWWTLACFIPYIGGIVWIVIGVRATEEIRG
jgi:uncharacterized membrane protein YhaH (DUF805 family)